MTWETPYYPLGRAGRIHQLLAALASLSVAAFFGNKISASRSRSGGEGIGITSGGNAGSVEIRT